MCLGSNTSFDCEIEESILEVINFHESDIHGRLVVLSLMIQLKSDSAKGQEGKVLKRSCGSYESHLVI